MAISIVEDVRILNNSRVDGAFIDIYWFASSYIPCPFIPIDTLVSWVIDPNYAPCGSLEHTGKFKNVGVQGEGEERDSRCPENPRQSH